MKRNLIWTLLGLVTGLWLMERERRKDWAAVAKAAPQPAPPQPNRKDRTIEEMSDYYRTRKLYLTDYDEMEIAEHLDRVALELIQPNMTPLEATRVANEMSEVARSAMVYKSGRKNDAYREEMNRTDGWLDDLGLSEDR